MEIDARALRGTNAAVDLDASWPRYQQLLLDALRDAFPDARIEIVRAERTRAVGVGDEVALRIEGIARAVRHCANWVVYEE